MARGFFQRAARRACLVSGSRRRRGGGCRLPMPGRGYCLDPGAAATIAATNAAGAAVVLVTNQAGIGRGYYDWAEFSAVQTAIQAALRKQGAHFDAIYACAHHPDAKGPFRHPDHPDRKPNPGMLLRAATDLSIDLSRSWLVGDHRSDIDAAKNAGLAGAIHVLTGHGQAERPAVEKAFLPSFELRLARSVADALDLPLLRAASKRAHS